MTQTDSNSQCHENSPLLATSTAEKDQKIHGLNNRRTTLNECFRNTSITETVFHSRQLILPLSLFITIILVTLVAQHGSQIMTDSPRKIATLTGVDMKEIEVYIPDSAKKNVRKYLDVPCIKAEIDYTKNMRKDGGRYLKNGNSVASKRCTINCEATISIIRHCEKDVAREHCAYVGYEHSLYLSTLFGNSTTARWPVPTLIFALAPGERENKYVRNWREFEMVEPLSHDNNLTIDYSYGMNDVEDLVKHIFKLLRSGELCGKFVLICWKHDEIPHLARSLGCDHKHGCPEKWISYDFDSVWEIQYFYHKLLNSPVADLETKASPFEAKLEDEREKDVRKENKEKWKKEKEKDAKLWKNFSFVKHTKEKKEKVDVNKELWETYPIWHVFGSVQSQGFDPLQFSKQIGEYQEGKSDNGYWLDPLYTREKEEEERGERK